MGRTGFVCTYSGGGEVHNTLRSTPETLQSIMSYPASAEAASSLAVSVGLSTINFF